MSKPLSLKQEPTLSDYSPYSSERAIIDFTEKIKELTSKQRALKRNEPHIDQKKAFQDLTAVVAEYKRFMQASRITALQDAALHIPAKSKIKLDFDTYCLFPGGAVPSLDEPYVLTNHDPGIPLYSEIMAYTHQHPKEVSQIQKQLLLWNLKNGVKFEDLSLEHQVFLMKVTPTAYFRVNNALKTVASNRLKGLIDANVPGIRALEDAYQLLRGKAYTYDAYMDGIMKLRSKYVKPTNLGPLHADGYDLYTEVESHGFSKATVTFFNLSASEQVVHSYFRPLRKDVQPLGFDVPQMQDLNGGLKVAFGELLIVIAAQGHFKLEPGDQLTVEQQADHLLMLWNASVNKSTAFEVTERTFKGNGEDDVSDAFRHAFWNAIMVRDIGVEMAEHIATNHELNPGSLESHQMDLWNNKIGRDIGKRLADDGVLDDARYTNEILLNKELLKRLK